MNDAESGISVGIGSGRHIGSTIPIRAPLFATRIISDNATGRSFPIISNEPILMTASNVPEANARQSLLKQHFYPYFPPFSDKLTSTKPLVHLSIG
jgi:hypothetical protein